MGSAIFDLDKPFPDQPGAATVRIAGIGAVRHALTSVPGGKSGLAADKRGTDTYSAVADDGPILVGL
jgi:hypothetical protein